MNTLIHINQEAINEGIEKCINLTPINTCVICLEIPSEFDQNYQCTDCDIECCAYCFEEYLIQKITNGQVASEQLVCPGEACNRSINLHQVQNMVAPEILQKYITFLKDFELRQRGYRFCPNPLCGQPLDIKNKRKRKIHCTHCDRTLCRKCGDDFHIWPQCEKKYQAWCTTNNTQPCPKCDAMIEKEDGCKHMTCGQCYYEFCWLCRGDWENHGSIRCYPSATIRSKHRLFGPPPLHIITKPVAAVVGLSAVVVAGGLAVGVALVATPPFLVYTGISHVLSSKKDIQGITKGNFRDDK